MIMLTQKVLQKATSAITILATTLLISAPTLAQHSGHSPSASDTPSMQMHKVMQDSNQKSMSMKMTGNLDRDFMMMMRHHHAAAIAMARVQVDKGKDKEMVNMAKKIIEAQTREIKELDVWMAKHPMK